MIGKDEQAAGLSDMLELKGIKRIAKGTIVDQGVRFYQEAPYVKAGAGDQDRREAILDPKAKYPQAWRTSRGGGQVKAEIGPLEE